MVFFFAEYHHLRYSLGSPPLYYLVSVRFLTLATPFRFRQRRIPNDSRLLLQRGPNGPRLLDSARFPNSYLFP
jgi:hypothetical protein